jgi:hypothetical protein
VTFGAATFTSGVGGSVTYTEGTSAITDRSTNKATTPQTITFAAFTTDTTRPLSQDIRITTNAGLSGSLDTGDVFTVAFNEVMQLPAALSEIRLTDADGTVARVICNVGGNANCVLSTLATTIGSVSYPAGQVITVTMTADPTVATAGTIAGLQLPSTVIDSSGFKDTAGNLWDIVNSPDKILN